MNEQQRLLNAIWNSDVPLSEDTGFDMRGISVYKLNLFANAKRSLSITFPTIFELLDSDVSDNLVEQFLRLSPPDNGDWAQWGEEFPHFIATNQIAFDYPYLPDCAELDWDFHCALQGNDLLINQASLAILGTVDPDNIKVIFNRNVSLIKTQYPINYIYQAHHHHDALQRKESMTLARLKLSRPLEDKIVMVFRPAFQPTIIELTKTEAVFMLSLTEGNSLGSSLDLIKNDAKFSFETWLIKAIENNLLLQLEEADTQG